MDLQLLQDFLSYNQATQDADSLHAVAKISINYPKAQRTPQSSPRLLLLPTQQLLRILILRPARLTLDRLQPLTRRSARTSTNAIPRLLFQALGVFFAQILLLALVVVVLVVRVAQRERIVVFLGCGSDGRQRLPFLLFARFVGRVDFVYGAGLRRLGLRFEEVGVGGLAAAGAGGLGGG